MGFGRMSGMFRFRFLRVLKLVMAKLGYRGGFREISGKFLDDSRGISTLLQSSFKKISKESFRGNLWGSRMVSVV